METKIVQSSQGLVSVTKNCLGEIWITPVGWKPKYWLSGVLLKEAYCKVFGLGGFDRS